MNVEDTFEKAVSVKTMRESDAATIAGGLNGDTGEGETFVHSDLTVSIGSYKTGHFMGKCREAMKEKTNIDIGIKIIDNGL